MAKNSQLREYQNNILARLENAKKAGAAAPAGYLGVVIGQMNVLVNLQEISETLPITHIKKVPLVKSWFLGLVNVRGVLYAINDISQLLENSFTGLSSNSRMLLISDAVSKNVAFMVDKSIGLRRLDEMTLREETSLDTLCFKPQTYRDAEDKVWYLLDCNQLVRSKVFATPYIS